MTLSDNLYPLLQGTATELNLYLSRMVMEKSSRSSLFRAMDLASLFAVGLLSSRVGLL
ncbi:hypothetical protein NSPZN2_10490 [Nitrospira defluvii]|uniref:Transposase n=1 Tax=Nitrospira defluvii TaxID=330214 RepID=A0ABM8QH07_9BACT|nr:hypothetical protein NSPZN2_10490 [Nitrospira defluvii]